MGPLKNEGATKRVFDYLGLLENVRDNITI
jgi:hypothetical protein